ncbi:MAG: flavodoxin [Candidatus Melainabacteria bacterium]|nr:MAG: flavodoxin [Candidatus Melainabacteria bacterium]
MKKILLFLLPILLLCTTGCTFLNKESKGDIMTNKRILIAYFSWSGNTKYIAEKIHNTTGGDMFRIETVASYPEDYNETAYGIAKKQHEEGTKPELKDNGDVSGYDVIFVGTPAWWYEMAPAVKTFLTENNFEGKTIVPFITHGGGGKYTIAEDIGKLAKGAKVLKPFVVANRGGSNVQSDIDNWLKDLK